MASCTCKKTKEGETITCPACEADAFERNPFVVSLPSRGRIGQPVVTGAAGQSKVAKPRRQPGDQGNS